MSKHKLGVLSLLALSAIASVAQATLPTTAYGQEARQASYCPSFGENLVGLLLSAPSAKAFAGADLPVKMSIVNLADRPLAGSAVVVRLLDREGRSFARYAVLEDLALPAGGAKNGTFLLKVPERLPTGNYIIEATFVASKEFSRESPDAPKLERSGANSYALPIQVEGPSSPLAAFDSQSVTVSEAGADDAILASVRLVNADSTAASIPVLWKVYRWNGISASALVDSKVELVAVPAEGATSATIDIADRGHAYYTVVAEADYRGLRSAVSFQAARDQGESLVSALGVSALPKDAAGNIDVYACVDNVFADDDETRRLAIEVTDLDTDKPIYRAVEDIPQGSGFELVKTFDPKGAQSLRVLATVFDSSGSEAGSYERVFDCSALGGCERGGGSVQGEGWLYAAQVAACFLGAVLAFAWVRRRRGDRAKKR